MKKVIAVIILVLLVGVLFWNAQFETKAPTLTSVLEEKGYSLEQVEKIKLLSEDNQNYLLEEDYQASILDYLNHSDFKEEKLKDYLEFSKLYGLSLSDTLFIVNNNYNDQTSYDARTVGFMHSTYYIHERLSRYLSYQHTIDFANEESEYAYVVSAVNSNLDSAFYTLDYETDLSKGNLMLVNKYYKLNSDYVPSNLVLIDSKYGNQLYLDNTVYEQYKKMWEDANSQGLKLYIRSPYRSYQTQRSLYNRYVSSDGKAAADTYSARPGYSEHQTGLAFDMTTKSTNFDTFEATKEFKWLKENGYKYGFILRYPKGKEYITGYIYEPWHYRYVGVEAATKIYETGLTYEEYYAYYVE